MKKKKNVCLETFTGAMWGEGALYRGLNVLMIYLITLSVRANGAQLSEALRHETQGPVFDSRWGP
jgi:hypothetical protein